MTKLSLDSEPPPKFEGKKEANRKKNGTLHQIILSLKGEKGKNKFISNEKKGEKKIKSNLRECKLDEDYPRIEDSLEERINFTSKSPIEFTSTLDKDIKDIRREFDYFQRKNVTYDFSHNYSFTITQTFIKDDVKKENYYSQSKEQEEKETLYTLHSFEEEENIEDNTIKWNAGAYN